MEDHICQWEPLETQYIIKRYRNSCSQFIRLDRFFCKICLNEKTVEKECSEREDSCPIWFDFSKARTIDVNY